MKGQPLVIVGAGGFGREVFGLIEDLNRAEPQWHVLGFLDDDPNKLATMPYYGTVLGPMDAYRDLGQPFAVCAIADPATRRRVVERLDVLDARWATLVHPEARVHPTVCVGSGSIIAYGTVIANEAVLGSHVHCNFMDMIGHDVRLDDYCTLSAQVIVSGGARIETGAFLGSHASVMPRAQVGAWARVGANSVAVWVRAGTTVLGVPAKRIDPGRTDGPQESPEGPADAA